MAAEQKYGSKTDDLHWNHFCTQVRQAYKSLRKELNVVMITKSKDTSVNLLFF